MGIGKGVGKGMGIELRGLSKRFQEQLILDDVSLDIAAGERVALVGANGAGKTTLVRCLLGQYRCEGEVYLDGLAPRRHRTQVLSRLSFVPQLPPALRMPVGAFLRFAASLSGCDTEPFMDVAERLGLTLAPLLGRPFVKLSGGQKQKVLIAVALGRPAELLLMDEPAANLDPPARKVFFELLAERRDHATMLISSHRLEDVASLVQRVVEMDQGRVTLDDRLDAALLKEPQSISPSESLRAVGGAAEVRQEVSR